MDDDDDIFGDSFDAVLDGEAVEDVSPRAGEGRITKRAAADEDGDGGIVERQ